MEELMTELPAEAADFARAQPDQAVQIFEALIDCLTLAKSGREEAEPAFNRSVRRLRSMIETIPAARLFCDTVIGLDDSGAEDDAMARNVSRATLDRRLAFLRTYDGLVPA